MLLISQNQFPTDFKLEDAMVEILGDDESRRIGIAFMLFAKELLPFETYTAFILFS